MVLLIVSCYDQLMYLLQVGIDEYGTRKLQLLENVWCPCKIQGRLAIVVGNRIIYARPLKQHAYYGCAA
jgi:hypothetical protein